VELKCVDRLANEHLAQCINYLKASGLHVALLVNFQRQRWNEASPAGLAASVPRAAGKSCPVISWTLH
jgi:hypothetical protein